MCCFNHVDKELDEPVLKEIHLPLEAEWGQRGEICHHNHGLGPSPRNTTLHKGESSFHEVHSGPPCTLSRHKITHQRATECLPLPNRPDRPPFSGLGNRSRDVVSKSPLRGCTWLWRALEEPWVSKKSNRFDLYHSNLKLIS